MRWIVADNPFRLVARKARLARLEDTLDWLARRFLAEDRWPPTRLEHLSLWRSLLPFGDLLARVCQRPVLARIYVDCVGDEQR